MSFLGNIRKRMQAGVPALPRSSVHEEGYVSKKILLMDSTAETTRVGKEYTHLSSLIGMCARRHLLAHITGLERSSVPRASMRLVWALGRAAEKHARRQFIGATGGVGVLGMWTCLCGFTKHSGEYLADVNCPRCKSRAGGYNELLLKDESARIVGSPDMLYARPDNGKVRVVEFKSMNKKDFDLLTAPKMDHVHQGMGYHELLRLAGENVDEGITVLYICKDFQWASPYKEFQVSRAPEHDRIIRSMWTKGAKSYKFQSDYLLARLKPRQPQRPVIARACASLGNEESNPKNAGVRDDDGGRFPWVDS